MKFEPNKITLRQPDDFHVHLRDGGILKRLISYFSFNPDTPDCQETLAPLFPKWGLFYAKKWSAPIIGADLR